MKTKLTLIGTLAVACAAIQLTAMPTAEETRRAEPVVRKLLARERAALRSGKKTRSEVAVAAMKLADEADTDAAKLLLMKGAFVLYVQDGNLEKAVETMNALESTISDMPPQSVTNMVETALLGVPRKEDGARLYKLLDEAKKVGTESIALKAGTHKRLEVAEGKRYTWSYRVKNGEATIVAEKDGKYSCAASPTPTGEVTIPPTLNGVKVTSIGRDAFRYCKEITSVMIPEGVTHIDIHAFDQCYGLKSVRLPSSLKVISFAAFGGCTGLGSVVIPEGVTRIEMDAFNGCRSLKNVVIPDSMTRIGERAFLGCQELTSVTIPAKVTSIGDGAFGCSGKLKQINLAAGNQAFTLVDGVLYKKDLSALIACPGTMPSVTIPSDVRRIAAFAFRGCDGLKSVTIPEGVTKIEWCAFVACGGLRSVTIPESVKEIGTDAFKNCVELAFVTMCGERPDAPNGIFEGCGKLKSIHVPANAKSWAGRKEWRGIPLVFDAGLQTDNSGNEVRDVEYKFKYKLDNNGNAILTGMPCVSPKPEGVLVVPSIIDGHKVTKFDVHLSFVNCDKMTKIILPDGLESFGFGTFLSGCSSLADIEISKTNPNFTSFKGVLYSKDMKKVVAYPKARDKIELSPQTKIIGRTAFSNCTFIKELIVPSGIERIESHTFAGMFNLEKIVFPASVNEICWQMFQGDSKLRKIIFMGNAPEVHIEEIYGFFYDAPENIVIEVKKGTKGWNGKGSTDLPEHWPKSPFGDRDSRPIRYMKETGSWTVAQYNSASPIPSFVEAKELVEKASKVAEQTYQTLSFENNYRRWGCFPHVEFPGTTAGENADYFAIVATGDIYVPNEGDWTFACLNDDGVRFTISGNGLSDTFENDGLGGVFRAPWLHTVHFPRAGIYSATCLFFENRGIAALEYSVARGSHSRFDSSKFKLVGDPKSGIVMVGAGEDADRQVQTQRKNVHTGALTRLHERRARLLQEQQEKLRRQREEKDKQGLYMIVDLTKNGKKAISYLDEAPKNGWSDEYRTKKIALRRIEPGSFEYMPGKSFKITKPFYIGVFEITQKQYEMMMKKNPSAPEFKGDMRPVEQVTYIDIRGRDKGLNWPKDNKVDNDSYLGKLRKRIGLEFDLPTEVQWEYACRAGTKGDFNVDGVEMVKLGKCHVQGGADVKVGSFMPNAWGLYDMHGNVWERCLDRGTDESDGCFRFFGWNSEPKESETDPRGPAVGTSRIVRGGGWCQPPSLCGSSARCRVGVGNRGGDVGFRLACPAGAQ